MDKNNCVTGMSTCQKLTQNTADHVGQFEVLSTLSHDVVHTLCALLLEMCDSRDRDLTKRITEMTSCWWLV